MAQWYYAAHGHQQGPIDEAALRQMIAQGQLRSDTLVWKEGMTQWHPIVEVSELQTVAPGNVPPVPSSVQGGQPASNAQQPYPQFPYAPQYAPVQQSAKGLATGGFVCSLLGLFCAGFVLGAVGIILSAIALNNMKKYNNQEGRGLAIAGLVIGIIGVPLSILGTILVLIGNH